MRREGREGGRKGRENGEGGREGRRGGREGGEGGREGGMTVIHFLMAPHYLNNNHVTYILRNNVSRRSIVPRRLHYEQWYVIRPT